MSSDNHVSVTPIKIALSTSAMSLWNGTFHSGVRLNKPRILVSRNEGGLAIPALELVVALLAAVLDALVSG